MALGGIVRSPCAKDDGARAFGEQSQYFSLTRHQGLHNQALAPLNAA